MNGFEMEDLTQTGLLRSFDSWIANGSSECFSTLNLDIFKGASEDEMIVEVPSLKKFKFYSRGPTFIHLGKSYSTMSGKVGTTLQEAEATVVSLLESFPSSVLYKFGQCLPDVFGKLNFVIKYGIIK